MAVRKHQSPSDAADDPATHDVAGAIRRARNGERVTLCGEGDVPVAAVVPMEDLRRLEADDRRRAEATEALMAVGDRFAHLDPEEVDREAVEAVREVRARMYAERIGRGG